MGNRCFIVNKDYENEKIHIYLQEYGGLEYILGFLQGARDLLKFTDKQIVRSGHFGYTYCRLQYNLFTFANLINNYYQYGGFGYGVYLEHSNDLEALKKAKANNGVYTIDLDIYDIKDLSKNLKIIDWNNKNEGQDLTISPDISKTINIAKDFYNINYNIFIKRSESLFETDPNEARIFYKEQD